MILKKPYAFLIKRFRVIHLILAVLVGFLLTRTYTLYSFFNRYVTNLSTSASDFIPTNYVTLYMFLTCLIIMAFSIAMFMLMKQKEKPTLLYILLSVYYVIYFIVLITLFSVFKSMETAVISMLNAMLFQDLMLILSIIQLGFLVVILIRALGFDIKKFNFSKDLQELDISEQDSEEFEFILGVDTYKYTRAIRKFLREFKYYYLENKFLISMLLIGVISVLSAVLLVNFGVYNKIYKVGSSFNVNGLNITVNDAYLTNLDYKNQVIDNDKYYLIVNMTFTNNSGSSTVLDLTEYYIKVNKQRIEPTLSRNKSFLDLGRGYNKEKIPNDTTKTYIMVFEIGAKQVKRKYNLEIYDQFVYKSGTLNTKVKKVLLVPTKHNKTKIVGNYKLNQKVSLSDTLLKNTTLSISDFEIDNKYTSEYEACLTSCEYVRDVVTSDVSNEKTLLILSTKLDLDSTSTFALNAAKTITFYDTFASVRYDDKVSPVKDLTPGSSVGKTILEVDDKIENAKQLDLLITVRGKQYVIKLKG